MSIDRYSQPTTGDLYPSANGNYVKYDDHYNEVMRLKATINSLYDQLGEIGELRHEVKAYKPTRDSKFLVRNERQDKLGYVSSYPLGFDHLLSVLQHLGKDENNVNIKTFALNELPVVTSLTVNLPE